MSGQRKIIIPDSSDLYPTPFKANLLPPPCGFANSGATCYWNALLQSLLTCTSIREIMVANRNNPKYSSHPVVSSFLRIYDAINHEAEQGISTTLPVICDMKDASTMNSRSAAIQYKAEVMSKFSSLSSNLWQTTQDYRKSKKLPTFRVGHQQDANEMFVYLTDILEDLEDVMGLITHRYQVYIYCHLMPCQRWISNTVQDEVFFAVDPSLRTPQREKLSALDAGECSEGDLQSYLMKRRGFVDEFYECPKCKIRGERLQIYRLRRIPSIIMITSKNYYKKENLAFPPFIRIPAEKPEDAPASERRFMRFEAVAQIQHSGGMGGGHYWAVARRSPIAGTNTENWWVLNDSSASQSREQLAPNPDTYCVLYHFICLETISV